MNVDALAADVRAHADVFDNEWDRQSVEWPLQRTDVIIEVGGYTGRWALQMIERHNPYFLYVFEPQTWAYEVCKEVLGKQAQVFNFALGTENTTATMGGWGADGCSLLKDGGETVQVYEMWEALFKLHIADNIALMMMNIEGYEYTLIPHMLDRGILPDRLVVQFHPQPEGDETMAIYDLLEARGYRVVWTYGVVLTAWERI